MERTYYATRWALGFQHAQAFYHAYGHLQIKEAYISPDGYTLGRWIRAQRDRYKKGVLSASQVANLERIGMLWRAPDRSQTSFAEQAVFFYLQAHFPDAQNKYKAHLPCELDIYIPSRNIGIEYDGAYTHNIAAFEKDKQKNMLCRNRLFLIRIREYGCPKLGNSTRFIKYFCMQPQEQLATVIKKLMRYLNCPSIDVDLRRDTPEIYHRLAQYGDGGWHKKYTCVKAYYQMHHHINVPYGYMDTTANGQLFNVGSWISDQRRAYKKGKLTSAQIMLLEALNIKWDYLTDTWMEKYRRLQTFYQKHGHIRLKQELLEADNLDLFDWLHEQRKMYRRKTLASDRIRLLNKLNIVWNDILEDNFQNALSLVAEFRAQHGHCRIPNQYITASGFPLGAWATRIKQQHAHKQLAPAREKALRAYDFAFDNYVALFQQTFSLAEAYFYQNGHLRIPQDYCAPDGTRLGKWINALRVRYWKGNLLPERIAQLERIGMIWRIEK